MPKVNRYPKESGNMVRKLFYLMVAGVSLSLLGCDGSIPTDPAAPPAVTAPRSPAFTTIGPLPPPPATQPPPPPPLVLPPPPPLDPPGSVAADIGPNGGTLSFGGNSLMVPPGALAQTVHIVMLPVCTASRTPGGDDSNGNGDGKGKSGKSSKGNGKKGGDDGEGNGGSNVVAAVQFFPEGLTFAANASPTLTVNTNCVGNPEDASIVYTDNLGNVLERFNTTSSTDTSISTFIHHFSRYAIAW